MNEGKDSDLLLQIYRHYKAESGTLKTKQLQALLNSLQQHFQTARLRRELAKVKWKHT